MQDVSSEEAKTRLTELMEATLRGERVVITLDDRHAIQLIPVAGIHGARQAGSARGIIVIRDDFDAPPGGL